jgi:secreted PhoX family phosphatase
LNLTRRQFGTSSLAALALGGCAWLEDDNQCREVACYGPLLADPAGFLDLPRGFSYRILSRAGEPMDDGWFVPDHFDGMGCIALDDGRIALVRNHELEPGEEVKGAARGDSALEARLAAAPVFALNPEGQAQPGAATTLILDPTGRKVLAQHLSLAGTVNNCAGGMTPWGSWLSCEETELRAPEAGRDHGWIFEVPAAARGLVEPVPLTAMGRFRHEAAAVDPATGIVYLTEDQDDGLFYRFIPRVRGQLARGGRLQALALVDGGTDSRNWNAADMALGVRRAARWIDLDEVESPNGDLRGRGHRAGAVLFARGEGIHLGVEAAGQREVFFTCTSGGAGGYGQVMRYRPSPVEGAQGESAAPGQLELFLESLDPALMDYADNLTIAPWGHLIVCEDRQNLKTNHLRGVTPEGRSYTLARLNTATELAGACFAPDGRTLFVNAYSPGRTLAITGPWDRFDG